MMLPDSMLPIFRSAILFASLPDCWGSEYWNGHNSLARKIWADLQFISSYQRSLWEMTVSHARSYLLDTGSVALEASNLRPRHFEDTLTYVEMIMLNHYRGGERYIISICGPLSYWEALP